MYDDDNFHIYLVIFVFAGAICFAAGFATGRDHGMEVVASGQYVCILTPAEDLTTSWVCEPHFK